MSNELIIAILSIGFVGSLAAFFVMWSFYDGQKKLTQKERDRRWDEISLQRTVEKEKDAEIEMLKTKVAFLEAMADNLASERDGLQDRLSALLCPTSNHIWKDGICIKCGRMKDD